MARQAAEPQPDHYDIPPQPGMTESDEEVVSNSCCGSVLCGSPEVHTLAVLSVLALLISPRRLSIMHHFVAKVCEPMGAHSVLGHAFIFIGLVGLLHINTSRVIQQQASARRRL